MGVKVYEIRRAKTTGTHVIICSPGIEAAKEEGWLTICEEHGGVVGYENRKMAEEWRAHPEYWCPTCRQEQAEKSK